ncbi:uncharacterized protein RJT21DRAFT_122464 [Scheffersomyces amazonensis]|uniref:uncharacterized protein n=1 Tax=Scheffersomyces amazonensis TaxID=1078765 RepID=UPI00315D3B96
MFKLRSVQITRSWARSITSSAILKNQVVKSSCAAGTVLNLKVRKNGDEPVALEDSEYPEWLWEMLDNEKLDAKLKQADLLNWKRREWGRSNRDKIKNNNFITQL